MLAHHYITSFRPASLVIKKYSPSRVELDLGLTMALECGLNIKWYEQDLPLEAFMEPRRPLVHDSAKMTLEHLLLALAIYCVILATSIVAFVKELVA